MIIRTTGKFVSVSETPEAAVTGTALYAVLTQNDGTYPADVPLMLQLEGQVATTAVFPPGQVRLTFPDNARVVPLSASTGGFAAVFPITFDLFQDMLVNGTPNFTAEYIPANTNLFRPSSASTRSIEARSLLSHDRELSITPDRLVAGENISLFGAFRPTCCRRNCFRC